MEGLKGLVLSDEEETEMNLGRGASSNEVINNGLSLVGRFLTDKTLNVGAMKAQIAIVWRPEEGVLISALEDDKFLFEFYHEVDRDRMLEGPLSPLITACWFGRSGSRVRFRKVRTWTIALYGSKFMIYRLGVC
ncbi:hypothetical protein M5689_021903 [Euphorbia peplus]|nr:hypothetical protein M5689_021903 [Euphorbia peplus]